MQRTSLPAVNVKDLRISVNDVLTLEAISPGAIALKIDGTELKTNFERNVLTETIDDLRNIATDAALLFDLTGAPPLTPGLRGAIALAVRMHPGSVIAGSSPRELRNFEMNGINQIPPIRFVECLQDLAADKHFVRNQNREAVSVLNDIAASLTAAQDTRDAASAAE